MPKKTEKKKDWTKVDVKDIKKHLPKILLFSLIILPLVFMVVFIGYLAWSDMQNAHTPDANSGITTDTKTYGVHTENKTSEANQTGTVSDTDFSNTTDLFRFAISWFPLIFGLYIAVKFINFLGDRD
jgi:hypothetical protein